MSANGVASFNPRTAEPSDIRDALVGGKTIAIMFGVSTREENERFWEKVDEERALLKAG